MDKDDIRSLDDLHNYRHMRSSYLVVPGGGTGLTAREGEKGGSGGKQPGAANVRTAENRSQQDRNQQQAEKNMHTI